MIEDRVESAWVLAVADTSAVNAFIADRKAAMAELDKEHEELTNRLGGANQRQHLALQKQIEAVDKKRMLMRPLTSRAETFLPGRLDEYLENFVRAFTDSKGERPYGDVRVQCVMSQTPLGSAAAACFGRVVTAGAVLASTSSSAGRDSHFRFASSSPVR